MIRLADYVMSFLEQHGVRDVFVVTGGGAVFLDDALNGNKNLRYYCCHHEQAVAMAAEAYARVRGTVGVSLVTTGPGGTNTITGVCGSWTDSVPHLIISGQVFLNQTIRHTGVRQLGVQEINIVDLVKPITKYAVMIEDPKTIKYHLQKAWYLATTGRPGPVWIDIPANIQNAKIEEGGLEEFRPPAENGYDRDLSQKVAMVVQLLSTAKRPLLHAGHGVRIAGAIHDFRQLVERYRLPFVTARNANDIIETSHELYIGRPGTFPQRWANFAVQNADLYIAIGTRLSLPQTGYNAKDYARNAFKVMVDVDKAELTKDTIQIDLPIYADARDFIRELNAQLAATKLTAQPSTAAPSTVSLLTTLPHSTTLPLSTTLPPASRPPKSWQDWLQQCQRWKEKYPVVLPEYEKQLRYVNSYYFAQVLSDLLTSKDIIVTDMGFAFQTTHQAFRVKEGQRLFTNSGFASMGWGLPAAIGACIASADTVTERKRTICLAGEGGFQMNIQELATVLHHQFPIKIFIYNNAGYLTQKQTFELNFGRVIGSDLQSGLSFPDYEKIAQAHKMPYFRIYSHAKMQERIENVLNTPGPVLCELMMDPNQAQIPKAVPRKRADGTSQPMLFEDLYPFLDEQELQENRISEREKEVQ